MENYGNSRLLPPPQLALLLDAHACSWSHSLFSSHAAPGKIVFVSVTKFSISQPVTFILA